jgi:dihydroorotase
MFEQGVNPKYDLVLKGGEVIDPAQAIHRASDVAFSDGKVAAVADAIPTSNARQIIDIQGRYVTPGLVDVHCHFYYGVSSACRDPRTELIPTGTTTAVEGGTAGSAVYYGLRDLLIKPGVLHLYAFLNIAALGLVHRRYSKTTFLEMAVVDSAAKMAANNPDTIVGIKVLLPGSDSPEREASRALLQAAIEAATKANTRVMVHFDGGLDLETVMGELRPGDILTHAFQGHEPTLIGANGKIRPVIREAVERGIVVDMSPAGMNHFAWRVAQACADQGLWPQVIGSDYATAPRSGPHGFMRTLTEAMTMALNLGMPIAEVIAATTSRAASAIGREEQHGSLATGRCGDATVLEMREIDDEFPDMVGDSRRVTEVLTPIVTVKSGVVAWQASGNPQPTMSFSTQ